jgi:hypothetical protein
LNQVPNKERYNSNKMPGHCPARETKATTGANRLYHLNNRYKKKKEKETSM